MAPARPLWVFAYGSLMWNPGFATPETCRARLHGWHRAFCIYSEHYRGTPREPGLILGLLPGGACRGLAHRLPVRSYADVRRYLVHREIDHDGVYEETVRPILLDDGRTVEALVYLADRAHRQFAGKLPPAQGGFDDEDYYAERGIPWTHGTINMNAVNAAGDVSSVTTTSGISWKVPGRVGDSPVIGAGQYTDNSVGAAGSTGRGESNIMVCGAFLAVEYMRQGVSPEQALINVMKRVIEHSEKRLLDARGRPYFDLTFYALKKDGTYAGACAYEGTQFAVCDAKGPRLETCAYLFKASERPRRA